MLKISQKDGMCLEWHNTITGELVYEQKFTNTYGKPEWHLKNQQGKDVSSGIYLYLITTKTGERIKGKMGVIE